MTEKPNPKHPGYCDGCGQLTELHTLGGHKRCKLLKKNLLPQDHILIASKGKGSIERPDECKKRD